MANGGARPDVSGLGSQVVMIYETFLLKDLLGYAFPGAVLLLGVGRLFLSQRPVLEVIGGLASARWLVVAIGLAAAYSAGVFLRLVGTWTHALVIDPVVGWCGDPWGLTVAATPNERSWWERPWRSRDEAAVVAWYRRAYAAGPAGAARVSDREDIFLHLAGSLGLALLIVGLTSVLGIARTGRNPAVLRIRDFHPAGRRHRAPRGSLPARPNDLPAQSSDRAAADLKISKHLAIAAFLGEEIKDAGTSR